MANRWIDKFRPKGKKLSFLRDVITGSMYRISEVRGNTSVADIHTQIDVMRALARDSQVSTALSYYATDATIANSDGQIIWAVPISKEFKEVAEIVNDLFKRWNINTYARDHILELATIGNLYIPTTMMYKDDSTINTQHKVALDNNTIPDSDYDIIPSCKIPPEDIIHIYDKGEPLGYLFQPDEDTQLKNIDYIRRINYPEAACIHFSLGGLLGDYTISGRDSDGNDVSYDIKFAQPMMEKAVTPTQTLGLLEDAMLLSSLSRVIRFINVECGDIDENEIRDSLQQIKDAIEQQLAINTASGDVQSFVNPQSPNNLIYLPMINGQAPISITDLNMAEASAEDSKLLDHYLNKKLSVLGVPKEALNFSANEGLGGAGSVLSQRSAIYANSLQRLTTAYKQGWTDAINKYFEARNYSGFKDKFVLQMQPIITTMSTVMSERRDSAVSQAQQIVALLKDLGVSDDHDYAVALSEALKEVFPQMGSQAMSWRMDLKNSEGEGGGMIDDF